MPAAALPAALDWLRAHRPRPVALAVVACCCLLLANSYLVAAAAAGPGTGGGDPGAYDYPVTPGADGGPNGSAAVEGRINGTNVSTSPVATAESVTVVTTQGFFVNDENADMVAFDGAGRVLYHEERYEVYFDVDPVPGERYTVQYVAAKSFSGERCATWIVRKCTRNVVREVNLSTGASETVYAKLTPRVFSGRWHDVDRVNETHLAIADIVNDSVSVVNHETGEVAWRWNATQNYTVADHGGKQLDWTHVNDVDPLPDGRLLVSLRNMDQVVFLEPPGRLNASWTLGHDDAHGILYEQHNPDYIPASRGGPAILVADSENNRVIEYRREPRESATRATPSAGVRGPPPAGTARDGAVWNRTWSWRDARLQWPRDADRLPSGHTLVVDSHGDRVLEVDERGEVVWNVTIGMPYDAERLRTGDGSVTGYAVGANPNATIAQGKPGLSPTSQAVVSMKAALPPRLLNGALYVSPPWFRFTDLLVAAVLLVTLLAWGGLEWHRSGMTLRRLIAQVTGFGL